MTDERKTANITMPYTKSLEGVLKQSTLDELKEISSRPVPKLVSVIMNGKDSVIITRARYERLMVFVEGVAAGDFKGMVYPVNPMKDAAMFHAQLILNELNKTDMAQQLRGMGGD